MFKSHRSLPKVIGNYDISLENQKVTYAVKRSFRARCVRLEIHRQRGLTVFIPRTYKIADLSGLLINKSRWILDKLAEFQRKDTMIKPTGRDTFPYLGKQLKVVQCHDPDAKNNINFKGNKLILSRRNGDIIPEHLILEWYHQQALNYLTERADELCLILGVRYNRLTIRKAITRWGSCSQRRNLNFNWKLIMIPKPIIEYVVIHELAHLKEMNHSKRFWNIVSKYCPDWRKRKQWLEEHESELNAINL